MSTFAGPPESSLEDGDSRLEAWTRRTDWPLTGLAGVFLATYAWQVLDTGASPWLRVGGEVALWTIWAVFAGDYVVKLVLARHKGRFLWRQLPDLLAVVLPVVRQLRVLRVLMLLAVFNRRAAMSLRGRLGFYVGGIIVLAGGCAALAVLDAERGSPTANITSFPDALWWTLTTITTVGYGDQYPTTVEGRLVASVLMIGGIALVAVLTGMIASWLVETIKGVESSIEQTTQQQLQALHGELTAVRAQLVSRDPTCLTPLRPTRPLAALEKSPSTSSTSDFPPPCQEPR